MTNKTAHALTVLVTLLAAGCGSSPTSPSEAPANRNTTSRGSTISGMYRGTTAQGRGITLVVENNALASFTLEYAIQGAGCTSSGTSTVTLGTPRQLVGNTFDYSESSGSPRFAINGTFTGTTGSGSATVTSVSQPFGGQLFRIGQHDLDRLALTGTGD